MSIRPTHQLAASHCWQPSYYT